MHGSRHTGGADPEIDISKVLGKNFREFVSITNNKSLDDFTFKKLGQKVPSGGQENDVSNTYTENVITFAAAFSQIENPDRTNIDQFESIQKSLEKDMKSILEGKSIGFYAPAKKALEFNQLPYFKDYENLVEGYNLYKFGKAYATNDLVARTNSSLVNLLLYTYYFISNLTFKGGISAAEIIDLLRTDELGFNKYVNEVVDNTRNIHFAGKNLAIDDGEMYSIVTQSLIPVVGKMIEKIKNVPSRKEDTDTSGKKLSSIATGNDNVKLGQYLADIGLTSATSADNQETAKAIIKLNGKNFEKYGDNSLTALGGDTEENQKQAHRYRINGLFNPKYLDVTIVDGTVEKDTFDYADKKYLKGGAGEFTVIKKTSSSGKKFSLPYLYGPKNSTDNDKQNLVTNAAQGTQGANANFVNGASVNEINNVIYTVQDDANTNINNTSSFAVVATILAYMIKEGKKFTSAIFTELDNKIESALKNNAKLHARLAHINNEANNMNELTDMFINQMAVIISRRVAPDAKSGEYVTRTPDQKNRTMQDEKIWNFYKNEIVNNVKFYEKYFNLVHIDGNNEQNVPNLDLIKNMDLKDRANYRLNVKKTTGYSRLFQTGGAINVHAIAGDIVFVTELPDLPNENISGIYLDIKTRIDKNELNDFNITGLARNVYRNWLAGNNQVTYQGRTFDMQQIVLETQILGMNLTENYESFLNNLIEKLSSGVDTTNVWKQNEIGLSERLLKSDNRWRRDGNKFVMLDKDGKEIKRENSDDCAFIKNNTQECLNTFTSCLPAETDADFTRYCRRFIDFDFEINPSLNELKKQVQKMNPMVALAILKRFKFAEYLEEEERDPIPGFRRFKVQSVGSWLAELMEDEPTDRCDKKNSNSTAGGDFECGSLRDQLGGLADTIIAMAKDPSKRNFFDYLDVLVHWVNANPQVLNEEEIIDPKFSVGNRYPPISRDFDMYNYVEPRQYQIRSRLLSSSCSLERLKANIMNDLAGSQAKSTVSNVARIPSSIEMTLNRNTFSHPYTFGQNIQFGGIYETSSNLANLGRDGHRLLSDIYRDIENTMMNINGPNRMELTNSTKEKIKNQLDSFQEAEEKLRKSLKSLVERNKLYQASRGHINAYNDDDAKYAAILAKHSNLLDAGYAYNRKAVNIIDLFQTINKVLLGRLMDEDKNDENKTKYYRPLSTGFTHYGKKN